MAAEGAAEEGDGAERWVLLVSVGDGAPAGGSGMQYFVGHFDGQTFRSENPPEVVLWADYGADAYAAQTWSDSPDGRRLAIAWMSNWLYGRELPTLTWRGAMTLPRSLHLIQTPDGPRLRQSPVAELTQLRGEAFRVPPLRLAPGERYQPDLPPSGLWEMMADFRVTPDTPPFQICLRFRPAPTGERAEALLTVDPQAGELRLDRSRSGQVDFHRAFGREHVAPLPPMPHGRVRLHLFVDHSCIEVFANQGQVVMTDTLFPPTGPVTWQIQVSERAGSGHPLAVEQLTFYPLSAARFTTG